MPVYLMPETEAENRFRARMDELVAQGYDVRVARDQACAERLPVLQRCLRCEGTGNQFMFMYQRCEDCGGTGLRKPLPFGWAGVPPVELL